MSESKQRVSEPSEKTRLNPFQKVYVIYGIIYGSFWLKVDTIFDMLQADMTLFIFTSAIVLVLTPVTLIYNRKYEDYKVNVRCCDLIAFFAVGCFAYRLTEILF